MSQGNGMTWIALAVIVAGISDGAPPAGAGAAVAPVEAVRELAARRLRQPACVQGVATVETGVLRSGPLDFYVQDHSGGIVVQGEGTGQLRRGEAVIACGETGLYEGLEPQLERARVTRLGKGKLPEPEWLSVEQAIDGVGAGKLVRVRGVVQRLSVAEERDALWLGPASPALRVYTRREASSPSALPQAAPVGATVELTGILVPEEPDKFQLRLRDAADIVMLATPEAEQLRRLRAALLLIGAAGAAVALWVLLLRRAVRRQTAQIRRLMVEAQQSEEAKTRFLANMSHEIRTPLNGVLGMTELALEAKPDAEMRSYLETIRSSARALLEIVDDVLDLSRIEKGRMRLEDSPFDLRRLVEEMLPLIAVQAERKGLRLEARITEGLPAAVMGDAGRLRQVLMNLLSNAVKFTAHGWVRLEVAPEADGRIRFAVTDTGIGIAPDKQREIFGAFVQADSSASRSYGGTGLGLTISEHLVRLMGGELKVESEPGRGSCFFFSIPLPEAALPPEDPGASAEAQSQARGLRILVAEDNEVNRRALESLLRRDGHFVRFACDGAEAVEAARTGGFDVILMDVQMPGMDGLEASRQIRELETALRRERTPIIGLTAHAFPEDARRCEAAGMDAWLPKPYHIADLRGQLARLAGSGCLRR